MPGKTRRAAESRRSTVLFWAMVSVLCCIIAFCAYKLISGMLEYKNGEDIYAGLHTYAPTPSFEPDDILVEEGALARVIDHEALKAINKDYIGWLYLPGTSIDYPVAKGSDNSYYISHTFDKKSNKLGSLFADMGNARDFTDRNTVIYGHNMRNSTMFADLVQYKDELFFKENPTMYLYTPEGMYKVEVFSAYVSVASGDQTRISFSSDSAFNKFLDERISKSMYKRSDITVTGSDRIVTFSTCSREYDEARTIVHGLLVPYTPADNPVIAPSPSGGQ